MDQSVQAAIVQAANEAGINPAFALAVADRESGGNPNAHASKSIYGLFQMRGDLRQQYGAGDSSDPLTQARAWTGFIGDLRNGMTARLGRAPTDSELYLGHFFGEGRASRLIAGQTPGYAAPSDVFTPGELAINPEIRNAPMVGNLTGRISADINRRMAKFGGADTGQGVDFAAFGQPAEGTSMYNGVHQGTPIDFASFGQPIGGNPSNSGASPENSAENVQAGQPTQPNRPGTEIDLSQFGMAA